MSFASEIGRRRLTDSGSRSMSRGSSVSASPGFAKNVRRGLAVVLCAGFASAPMSAIAADPQPDRLQSIGKLLNASSAARSAQSSDNPEVARLYAQSKTLYQQAVEAAQRGDLARRDALLDESAKTLFEAVRLVDTPIHMDKGRLDFARRRDSIEALADAYVRVAAEKDQVDAGEALRTRILAQLEVADELLAGDDLDGARARLDEAYAHLRSVLGEIRDGDTLVQSLSFDTPEQEYLYELDRNETHRILIEVLLTEKFDNPATRARVTPHLEAAADKRANADGSASEKNFDEAIELMEASTREYVRALRLAGVYVPG